jgi:hypothetical protein
MDVLLLFLAGMFLGLVAGVWLIGGLFEWWGR